jgi:hypothetical protein
MAAGPSVRLRTLKLRTLLMRQATGRAGLGYWRSELSREPGTTSADRYVDPYFGAGMHYRVGRVTLRSDFDLLALRLLNALDSAPRDHGWIES